MRLLAPGRTLSCCLSIVIMAFAASGCGAKGGSKGRLSETNAGPSVNQGGQQVGQGGRVIGDVDLRNNPNIGLGRPRGDDATEILISRDQYVISWSPEHRAPNWVAWRLADSDLGAVRRTNSFALDPDLDQYLAANGGHAVTPQDFQGSCFDRGHMTPSADRTASEDHNRRTFLMSNMMPQTAYLNRGIWEHFEEHERNLVRGTDQAIYIIAGAIFDDHPGHIGPDGDIAVPSKNFKIVLRANDLTSGQGTVLAAILMPNSTSAGTDPLTDHEQACADSHHGLSDFKSVSPDPAVTTGAAFRPENTDWQNYQVSVGEIAQYAGLNFPFAH